MYNGQRWAGPLLPVHTASGTAYASSTTLTDVSLGAATAGFAKTSPASCLEEGMTLRLRAMLTASNTSTPTLLLGFYYGGVAGTALAATSAITTTTAMSGWTWWLEYEGVIRTRGASGTILGAGEVRVPTSLTAWTIRPIPETTPAAVTIDTTAQKVITVGAQWGTSSSSNTLTCLHFDAEIIG